MAIGRIRETIVENEKVRISIDGILDKQLVEILQRLCDVYTKCQINLVLDVQDIMHFTIEGKDFLKKISCQTEILNLPKYIKLL